MHELISICTRGNALRGELDLLDGMRVEGRPCAVVLSEVQAVGVRVASLDVADLVVRQTREMVHAVGNVRGPEVGRRAVGDSVVWSGRARVSAMISTEIMPFTQNSLSWHIDSSQKRSVYDASQMTVSEVAFSPRQCPRQPS